MSPPIALADAQNERRIRSLGEACKAAHAAGDRDLALSLWRQFRDAIFQRTPEQIHRMETRMGLQARTSIKRTVMAGFVHGILPATAVTALFKAFELRDA